MSTSRQPSLQGSWSQRLLLLAYPRAFRREFAPELVDFWELQRQEPRFARPALGRARFWLALARDAGATGLRMRWRQLRGRHHSGVDIPPPGRHQSEASGLPRVIGHLLQDLRGTVRVLRAAPFFSAIVVLTLALAIGANAAVFSVADGVLLRPLDYPESERLARVWRTDTEKDRGSVSLPGYEAWAERARSFESLSATHEDSGRASWGAEAEMLSGLRVTRNFFTTLGVPPALGRTFTADEDQRGGPPVVMLSESVWRARFEGRPEALGETLLIDGAAHTIVGVVPDGVDPPLRDLDFYRPLQRAQAIIDLGLTVDHRGIGLFDAIGRLSAGSTTESAAEELIAINRQLDEELGVSPEEIGAVVVPYQESVVGDTRGTLLLTLVSVTLLLVTACANVAGLWVSRVAGRSRELALRSALGAERGRVARQLVLESLLLSALGGVGGILLARALIPLIAALAGDSVPRMATVGIDGAVLGFTAGVSILCGAAFGLAPALRASAADPGAALREGDRGSAAGVAGQRLQRTLAVAQVAVSVILLAGAALLANSFLRLLRVDPGFETEGVLTTWVGPQLIAGDTDAIRAFYDELMPRIRALPGVETASFTYSPPMADNNFRQLVAPEGAADDAEGTWAGTVIIGADYFRTVGVRLVRGREFGDGDRLGAPHVAIVNEAMAQEMWPGLEPLGQAFRFADGISGTMDSFEREFFSEEPITVVGVAANVRRRGLGEEPVPEFYRPHPQMSWPSTFLLMRTRGEAAGLLPQVRKAVWDIDATVPVEYARTLQQRIQESVATPRFRLVLLGSFAAVASFLAMLGVYAVMALVVSRRTHDIGVRMALGAVRARVLRDVMTDGMQLALLGVGIGLPVSLASNRVLSSMLYAVTPTDVTTHAVVATLTLLVAAAACYLPARRAARLDPLEALRSE